MIKHVFRSYLINLFALWATSQFIGAFILSGGVQGLLIVGAGFTILHLLIRPLLSAILGTINFLTLGLVGLLLDSAILYGLTLYFPQVSVVPWDFPGGVVYGFILPPYSFGLILATILTALIINVIRQTLQTLAS